MSAKAKPGGCPPGYKQTEVGVIPEKWDAVPLGRMIKLQGGYAFRSKDFSDIGVPVIRISDIQGGVVHVDRAICHPPIQLPDDFVIRQGDVLVAMSGATTGKVGLFQHSKPAYQNQRVGKFVVRDKIRTSPGFVEQLVRSSVFVSKLGVFLEQGAQPNISGRQIESLVFAAPRELPDQRAIAGALSDVDAQVGALDQLIAKKRDLKQAAMQQLLTGRRRLPGFHGEWEVKTLGEIGDITSAGVDKKSRPGEVPVRLVNYLDVYRRDFIYSDDLNHWVTAPSYQARRCAVQKGDVFFTPSSETRDDIGISALAMEDIPDAVYSYHVVRLRLKEEWDLRFRTYAFKTKSFLDQAETLCDGSGTRYVISQGKFRSMTVKVPPVPEQTAIAEIISDIDTELAALEQRRDKTRALKQGMMQELLTGRTRLA